MGTDTRIKEVSIDELHIEVLPPETQQAFRTAIEISFLQRSEWYLAGGTALALQVGHRSSEDLDFFTMAKDFETGDVERLLLSETDWKTIEERKGTLYGLMQGAKVSFIAYPFFQPSNSQFQCGTIRILEPDDIACMKIIAISQRGRKRDFVDMYWYLAVHGAKLRETILRTLERYPEQEHSLPHFIKSLTYFADAEEDPMPRMHFDADWESIQAYFKKEVPPVAKELLGITD